MQKSGAGTLIEELNACETAVWEALKQGDAMSVGIGQADGEKCERCWNFSTEVGVDERFPTVCERCIDALDEMFEAKGA